VHALVAEVELGGDLAHRRACRVKAADRVVEVRARVLELVLGVDHPHPRRAGRRQDLGIERHLLV
jgi:hypothetical protein